MNRPKLTATATLLDRRLPLAGASHADVARYSVDIPMRYAECFATLADGQTARLQDAHQLLGRTGDECDCLLLFAVGDHYLLLSAETRRVVELGSAAKIPRRRFIARDGSLLELPTVAGRSQPMPARMPRHSRPALPTLHATH